jgi:hypothetical protein
MKRLIGILAVLALTLAAEAATVAVKKKPADTAWVEMPTLLLEELPGFKAAREPAARDEFGGNPAKPGRATGFFRVEPAGAGDWRLRDPLGNEFFSAGVCGVSFARGPTAAKAAAARFGGDRAKWALETAALLRTNGFNTLGAWSDAAPFAAAGTPMPYCTQLSLMGGYGKSKKITTVEAGHAGYPDNCIPVFDPEFPAFCEARAEELLKDVRNDPRLLGHFSDNELPFPADALDRFYRQAAGSPGRRAAEAWMTAHGVRPDADGRFDAPANAAFQEHVAETYFAVVAAAIRKADPNHLYLGSRLYGKNQSQAGVFRACGKYADVVSFNLYSHWTPKAEALANWVKWSNRPFMITEYYAKGMDSSMGNVSGAGWVVKTQEDRGRFYQNFTLGLLRQPGCVGFHWFRYQDNDPADRSVDPSNRDSNKGIVAIDYEPYRPLLARMKALNDNVYALLDFFRRR